MQTTASISQRLIELLREKEFLNALEELFSDDTISIDPLNPRTEPLTGLANIIEQEKQFLSLAKIHSINISDAIVAGDYFTISLSMDFSFNGAEKHIDELCVYKVSQQKVISQQFFVS